MKQLRLPLSARRVKLPEDLDKATKMRPNVIRLDQTNLGVNPKGLRQQSHLAAAFM